MSLAGKTVLVTGGTGFVGGRLAERLFLEEHARVRVLVHQWAKATWAARYPLELVPGDVTDAASLRAALAGCALVFHCASGGHDADSYRAVNVAGTRNVLEAARLAGVERLVHVGSAVAHDLESDGLIDETRPFRPSAHPYTDSKIKGEELVWDCHRREGLPVTVIRPAFVWGPRGAQYTLGPVQAMRDGRFRLVDEGHPECPVVHVDHLVDALLLAATAPGAVGEAFLVSDGEGLTWRDYFTGYARMLGLSKLPSIDSTTLRTRGVAALTEWASTGVARLAGSPAPLWRRVCRRTLREFQQAMAQRGVMSRRQLAMQARRGGLSIRKAREVLGYQPRMELAEAMRQTEEWLRDQYPLVFRTDPGDF